MFSHEDHGGHVGIPENKEMAAMMVYQTNPPRLELYFYANTFFCLSNPIWLLDKAIKRERKKTITLKYNSISQFFLEESVRTNPITRWSPRYSLYNVNILKRCLRIVALTPCYYYGYSQNLKNNVIFYEVWFSRVAAHFGIISSFYCSEV